MFCVAFRELDYLLVDVLDFFWRGGRLVFRVFRVE